MKRHKIHTLKNLIFALFFIGSFVRPVAAVSAYKTVRVGVFFADGFFEKSDIGYYGYAYDLYVNLGRINMYQYEFVECELTRCLTMLENKEIDVVAGIQLTDEREKKFAFTSVPMGVQSGSVFVRNRTIPYGMLEAMEDMKIGFVFDEYHSMQLLNILIDAHISLIPIFEHSFETIKKKYDTGVIDGFVSTNFDPTSSANRIYSFDERYMYIAANKDNVALIHEFNEGLAILVRNGFIKSSQLAQQRLNNNTTLIQTIAIVVLFLSFAFSYFVLSSQKEHQRQMVWKEKRKTFQYALKEQQFFFVYQPIIDIHNNVISHLEALIRWKHDVLGIVPPIRFLDDINQCFLMFELFSYTLRKVVEDYVDILSAHPSFQTDGFHMSINVTYTTLIDERFIPEVKSILDEFHLNGTRLCFEITEQMQHENVSLFNDRLIALRSLGCKVAMDDFGMEYSSLLTLKQSDYDIFKIDKYFVDDILSDKTGQSIALAILAIGQLLHKQVVAEGVESIEQVRQLHEMGCSLIQGYYFSKPLPLDALLVSLNSLEERMRQWKGGNPNEA